MPFTKRHLLAPLVLTAGLALAGCSGSSPEPGTGQGSASPTMSSSMEGMPGMGSTPSASAGAAFNGADAMFAQTMLPHHQQAVAMSEALLAKAGIDPRVVSLATRIKSEQQPEIDRLRSWLGAWGQPPATPAPGQSMDGMMGPDEMAKLDAAQGPTAGRLFLTQMTAHHQGAVAMARTEASGGKNPDAVAMAKSIVDSQSAEVTEMKALLASL